MTRKDEEAFPWNEQQDRTYFFIKKNNYPAAEEAFQREIEIVGDMERANKNLQIIRFQKDRQNKTQFCAGKVAEQLNGSER